MYSRRDFLKRSPAIGGLGLLAEDHAKLREGALSGEHISFRNADRLNPASPMQSVELDVDERGKITVLDGLGRPYVESEVEDQFSFDVGGALGRHILFLEDRRERLIDVASFTLDTKTFIRDSAEVYSGLLDVLYWTMTKGGATDTVRLNGKFYNYFVRWLRDHVHTLKGMKYFHPELKSAIDLYVDTQREDGMIWDNVQARNKEKNWWDKRFRYGDFIRDVDDGTFELKRIPIEADVEYLFVEGIYHTWKATGDDDWMTARLDAALQAVDYSTHDPYRWSDLFQLIRRGFTIDTWDFQSEEDAVYAGNDIMAVYLDKTYFGIMFGDNTGLAAACQMLAEMLRHTGRREEADSISAFGVEILDRTREVCWNGRFFTHHVPEDESVRRNVGVDQSEQVSLSNAYSLNRGIEHQEAAEIIKTYQRIREEMPESSPGEWYTIYPPFQRGFDGPAPPWEYINGGVTSIVAGELAHGAFQHGFEDYGVDILQRVLALSTNHDRHLPSVFRGNKATPPPRLFEALNLWGLANVDFPGDRATFGGKRLVDDAPEGDLRLREFSEIPFEVIDPEKNERRSAIELTDAPGGLDRLALPLGDAFASIYLLHTCQGRLAGMINLLYEDGTTFTDYVDNTKYGNWWHTPEPAGKAREICQKAWRSDSSEYVGLYVYGLANPHPNKRIRAITMEAAKHAEHPWRIVAITLSDATVYLDPGPVSYGIPNNWGAAAVTSALIEGLAGITDNGAAFDSAILSPRWAAAGEASVEATAKYEASGGYLAYTYERQIRSPELVVRFTGSMRVTRLEVLLPEGLAVSNIKVDGRNQRPEMKEVEASKYACCVVTGVGVHTIEIEPA